MRQIRSHSDTGVRALTALFSFTNILSACIVHLIMALNMTMWLNATTGGSPEKLGVQLAITLLVLAAMAGLAYLTVRIAKPRINSRMDDSRMSVVSRLQLDSRNSIYLIRVDQRELVVGVTERGLELLSEISSGTGPTND